MLKLGPLPPRIYISWLSQTRHASQKRAPDKCVSPVRKNQSSIAPSKLPNPKRSLFAELFPEEAERNVPDKSANESANNNVPTLPLPTVAELLEGFDDLAGATAAHPRETTKAASSDAYKHRKVAVLVLQSASKSLVESDFRRIVPKGEHIGEWTGPGDILKVFPARDPTTLGQAEHYFIFFANPAYARTYQSHVLRLYRMARQHTPTSIESPLPPQRGVTVGRHDAHAMLQDFALCPPSQRIQLKYLYAQPSSGMRRLLDQGGYLTSPDGTNRAGRAVLFWVDGNPQPAMHEVKNIIALDGLDRGLAWDTSVMRLDAAAVTANENSDEASDEAVDRLERASPRQVSPRWVLTFSDENEARSFIRAWHRKHLPSTRHDEPRIVHVEFLW